MTAREKAVSEAMEDVHTGALPLGLALDLVYGRGRLDAAKIIKNSAENVDVSAGDRSKCRYDIEVEGNNNFIANGILVHNSKIQRGYGLTGGEKRFSLFNTHRHEGIEERSDGLLRTVPVLYIGPFSERAIHRALADLQLEGSVAEPGYMTPEGVVTFHSASNSVFKTLIEGDEQPKGEGA